VLDTFQKQVQKSLRFAFLSCCLLFITFNSCKKSTRFENDYLTFGLSVRECDVNCVQFFMIADGKLYEDAQDKKYDRIKFNRRKLSSDKYDIAKKLLDNFPDYFKTTTSSYFGQPDSRDQGEIIIEWKEKGKGAIKWRIDTDTSAIPIEIRKYISEVQNVIMYLK
jgi:hypothetical protein